MQTAPTHKNLVSAIKDLPRFSEERAGTRAQTISKLGVFDEILTGHSVRCNPGFLSCQMGESTMIGSAWSLA